MAATKRSLVTLPLATHTRLEAFRDRHNLNLSNAMKMLITEGLDTHAAALGEAPLVRLWCGCDPELTCAAAFNRKFEGLCRLAPASEEDQQ